MSMRQTCSEPITSSLQVCLMHTHLLVQFKLQDVVKVRRTPTCGVAPALCSFIEEKVADRAIISSDIGIGMEVTRMIRQVIELGYSSQGRLPLLL